MSRWSCRAFVVRPRNGSMIAEGGRRAEERPRLLSARHRDRMGRRPDRLPLWRLDRLSRDHRAVRTAAAGRPDRRGARPTSPRSARSEPISPARRSSPPAIPPTSLFFLRSGVVHVTLPDGIRLATLTAGMAFGEMALLETHRSADVFADMAATASKCRWRISSVFAGSTRAPPNASCATWRSCWPTA